MALQPNQTIINGKYRILELIGEGGMARVWLAEELTFGGRQVAIKEPRLDLLPELIREVRLRYQQEVDLCAALTKARAPNIVKALTAEPYGDSLLLVLEYMPGGDLAALLKENPAGLPVEQAITMTLNVLQALGGVHAHELEIVHRDIKPSNILFDDQGIAHLSDFGLAQVAGMSGRSQLHGGQHPGTPMYMAPEQETSPRILTPAADLYALGCVLFEMLTGQRYKRYRPGTRASELRPELPDWLDDALAQALVEDPWNRPQQAQRMALVLREALQKEAEAQKQAEQEAQRQARELELARGYEAVKAALAHQNWEAALQHLDGIQQLVPGYRDTDRLRAEAEAGRKAQQEADLLEGARQAELARLYQAAQSATTIGDWSAVLRHLDQIARLEPTFRDPERLRARANAGLRARQKAEEEERHRQQRLADLYGQLQAIEKSKDWARAADLAQQIEAEQPGYRDVSRKLSQFQSNFKAEQAARTRRQQREQWLAMQYSTLLAREQAKDWRQVVELAREIEAKELGYRNVKQHLRKAEKALRTQQSAQRQRRSLPTWLGIAIGAILLITVGMTLWVVAQHGSNPGAITATASPTTFAAQTPENTNTPQGALTETPTESHKGTASASPSASSTRNPVASTLTPLATGTSSAVNSTTLTAMPTPTRTPSATATSTRTATPKPSPTVTNTPQPTKTPTPSPTNTQPLPTQPLPTQPPPTQPPPTQPPPTQPPATEPPPTESPPTESPPTVEPRPPTPTPP